MGKTEKSSVWGRVKNIKKESETGSPGRSKSYALHFCDSRLLLIAFISNSAAPVALAGFNSVVCMLSDLCYRYEIKDEPAIFLSLSLKFFYLRSLGDDLLDTKCHLV